VSGLLRSNLVVAAGTALSRLTGLVRVGVFAVVIGQAAFADAYTSANNSPNAIYELLLGGVLSAALVPMFTRHSEDGDDTATNAVVTTAAIVLTAITALAVAAAPLVFHLFSIDVADGIDPEQYRSAGTAIARIFLLQIFFYGLAALANSLLQARRRFFAPAWAPVLSNVIIITSLILASRQLSGREPTLVDLLSDDRLRWTLGLGATLGIATMALVTLPALYGAGVRLRFVPRFGHPAVRELVRLSAWTLGYVVSNQIAIVVIQNLAEPGTGALNAYATAYIFFVLPHGLLAMSIVTTFTPELASAVKRRDRASLIERASLGLRMIALLTVPAAALMFVLRRPLIGLGLQHGNFDAGDTLLTSRALAGFALGLLGFSVYLFTLRIFYAHGDARTPFIVNVVENVINVVLAVLLVGRFGVLGLGAAFAIAYTLSAVWALVVAGYKVPGFSARSTMRGMVPLVIAGLVMAEVTWIAARLVGDDEGIGAFSRLVVASACGLVTYAVALRAMKVPELDHITQLAGRAFGRPGGTPAAG
jgi:putative peptidoglycan lipid II flippase